MLRREFQEPWVFFLLAALLLNASCTPILKTLYGIKKPDIETPASLSKAHKKFGLENDNVVCINSNNFLQTLKGQGIPDASVFDRNGKYIEYRQTDTSCNAGLFQFIPDLNKNGSYKQPDTLSLQKLYENFYTLEGKKASIPSAADFYVLIYYTVWTGKLNKDHVKIWEEQAKTNQKANIKVIKVNLDMQLWWPEDERKKLYTIMRNQKKNKN